MSAVWPQLVLVGALVLVNALFAGAEMALVSLREGQIQRLEERSATGAVLARLARDPNRFLATIQVGITLAGFLASASAAVSLAEPLEEPLGFLGGAAGPVSIVVVTLILSYLTLVLGELAPKRLAMQRAERWGLLMARPLAAISVAARPVVWLLSHSTDLVVRLLGGDPSVEREAVTEEEVRDLIASQLTVRPEQRIMLSGAFEIRERTLDQVMRPRPAVFLLDADAPCAEALVALAASGHSRAPVCVGGSLDDVVGVVHLRDLLVDDPRRTVREVAAPPTAFPETATALDVLQEMRRRRVQLAVVVSEYGGVEGIVTVEDLVEELVGEIYDESDRDVLTVRRTAGGALAVPGRHPARELTEHGIELPEGDYATVAGFVLAELGRIPTEPGDVVTVDGWRLVVTAIEERTITEVEARPVPGAEP